MGYPTVASKDKILINCLTHQKRQRPIVDARLSSEVGILQIGDHRLGFSRICKHTYIEEEVSQEVE